MDNGCMYIVVWIMSVWIWLYGYGCMAMVV